MSPSRIAFIGSSAVARGLGRGADVALLTVDDWRAVVDEALPDLLLLQVAAPMEGGWWDASGSIGGAPSLEAVTAWAAARGVPSVCWVTEPAERAGRFVSLLGLCDRVFCVDPEAAVHVDAADAGERYAGELQLATDPPEPEISRQLRSGVVYAGGWSSAWSDRSRRMLAMLLSAAEPHGLTLLQRPGDPNDWSAVHDALVEPIDLADMPLRLRSAAVAIAFDPAIDARRYVPELAWAAAAQGTVVLTGPNWAARHYLDACAVGSSRRDAVIEVLAELFDDPEAREARGQLGRRIVTLGGTWEHRLSSIASAVGRVVVPPPFHRDQPANGGISV